MPHFTKKDVDEVAVLLLTGTDQVFANGALENPFVVVMLVCMG